jgi:hypothetical protein
MTAQIIQFVDRQVAKRAAERTKEELALEAAEQTIIDCFEALDRIRAAHPERFVVVPHIDTVAAFKQAIERAKVAGVKGIGPAPTWQITS